MKKKAFLIVLIAAVFNPFFLTAQVNDIFRQEGIASWYGREYDGRPTASGEIFDSSQLTAAHPNLPFGTRVVVTNQHNNKSVTVRINDRGPFVPARIIDVSRAAAEQIDMIVTGTAPVRIESIDRIAISNPQVTPQTPVFQTQPEIVTILPAPQATPQPQTTPQPQVTPQPQTTPQPQAAPVQITPQPQVTPQTAPVVVQPVITPVTPPAPQQLTLIPSITIVPEKTYRLQVGSYKSARNAVEAFDRLKNAGLNPVYERYMDGANNEFFRVVVTGIRGADVQMTTDKLTTAGFKEALIREEI